MRSYTSKGEIVIKDDETILQLLDERILRTGNCEIYKYKNKSNVWETVKALELKQQIEVLSAGMLQLGIKHGTSVAIMAATSFDWIQLDFALLRIGVVVVPIYESASAEQIQHILRDADVKYIFTENNELTKLVESVDKNNIKILNLASGVLDTIKQLVNDSIFEQLEQLYPKVQADDLATIVYTSGSTGIPKGVEITHRNFIFTVRSGLVGVPEVLMRANARLLLFLPLAHVFARFLNYSSVAGTTTMSISSGTANLVADLNACQPTYLLGVPRVFEKLLNMASHKAGVGLRNKIFLKAKSNAVQVSKLKQLGQTVPKHVQRLNQLYDYLVYSKIKQALGGHVEYAVSGGAPLDSEVAHFFNGMGLTILEGYGLTETAAPALVNRIKDNVIGTIGQPLPNVSVAIAEDGEILIKSDAVMKGYHISPITTLTQEHPFTDDGWLQTGDFGEMLDTGHVKVIGRKKDILVTAGGKNVNPTALEETVTNNPIVSHTVVVGDKKPFVGALITLDPDSLQHFFAINKLGKTSNIAIDKHHPLVVAEVEKAVNIANHRVSRAESIRKYLILDDDFTVENELLTASMKVRRNAVIDYYHVIIEKEIYGRPA